MFCNSVLRFHSSIFDRVDIGYVNNVFYANNGLISFHYSFFLLSKYLISLFHHFHVFQHKIAREREDSRKRRKALFSAFKILQESPNYIEMAEHDQKIVTLCNLCDKIDPILMYSCFFLVHHFHPCVVCV
jgi:hypothetical protein